MGSPVAMETTVISTVGKRNNQGYTYVIVLVSIVIISIMAQVAAGSVATEMRREKEAELLFRGTAYREAIRRYYRAVPGSPAYPRRVEDLVADPRFMHARYIRHLYKDPTGHGWRVLRDEQGRIVGVASSDSARPLKQSGFVGWQSAFEGAKSYTHWEFTYFPGQEKTNVNRRTKKGNENP